MSALLTSLIDAVLGAPPWLVYVAVGAVVLAEDALFVGFVLPGETLAIIGGVTASLGHTSLVAVLAVVIVTAVVGDSIGYEIGRVWGARILDHRVFDRHRNKVEGARDVLRDRGGVAVFLARWTAFLRAVTPALSGAARMHYRTFLPWNLVGGATWGATVVLLGFFAGQSYHRVESWLGRGAAAVVAAVALVAVAAWQVRKRRAAQG